MIKSLVWKKKTREHKSNGVAGQYSIWKPYGRNEYHLCFIGSSSDEYNSLFRCYKSYKAAEKAANQHNQALILDWVSCESN